MSTGEKIVSSQMMDEKRHLHTAYEYLCRLEEAKKWIEHNLHIELPSSSELEESLRNGVVLARLANFYAPELITEKKIYDINLVLFKKKGLHYKYTDNIINFLKSMSHIGFPKVFFPETTDIYDMKNMPKLIYCIHALSMYLYKLGKAYPIQDLMGKVQFSDAELQKVSESLKKYGVQMPAFSKIGGILASELSEDDAALHAAILLINEALDNNDTNLLIERMKSPSAQLFGIHDEYADDYMSRLKQERSEKVAKADSQHPDEESKKQEDVYDRILTQKEIQERLSTINLDHLLVDLTQHARARNEEQFIDCLVSRDMNSRCVLYDNRDLYMKRFHKHVKQQPEDYILNIDTVNELVSQGNSEAELRKRIVNFVTALNAAVHELTPESLLKYIDDFKVELAHFDPKYADSYVQWIQHRLEKKKQESNDPNAVLWFDEVEACIIECNKAMTEAKHLLHNVETLNQHVMSNSDSVDSNVVYENLNQLGLGGLTDACKELYAENICKAVTNQNFVDWNGWTDHKISSMNNRFYYNHNDKKYMWFDVPELQPSHGYINKERITDIVNDITANYNNELYLLANTPAINLIQAFHRTHKVHLSYIQRPLFILLQSLFRTLSVMKMYKKVNQFNKDHSAEIEVLQKFARVVIARQPFVRQFEYLNKHRDTIVSLQSVIRARMAHRDYHNLVHSENPPCSTVCRFVRLLDFDANDMREEKELENLRTSVVRKIKDVNEKEAENKEIDVRIGLLVKNKLKIQDVLTHSQGKSKKLNELFLPSITKDKQILIDKLGTLFYILQMHPEYTAHLIMSFFGDRNSKFVKDTCYALFNYGTYLRDEYTLIKMFSCAMVVEIETKIQSINEFIKGDPLILKIAVHFYRNSKAQTWLEDIISDCVKNVVNNKYSINTNPLDIYKQWISQIETETGQASGYPYDVDTNTAMSYDEVKKRLSVNISNMKNVCSKFIEAITGSASKIPYGIRYLARTLYDSLKKRFPDEPDSSYYKIVGNLLYYRLINPAIVSPDTFNMLSSSEISAEKRKNLASISVVIQRSASHNFAVGTTNDNPMLSLNEYMASTWTKIINWFDECMKVDNLETHFNIDEFTDQAAIRRPELNLTIGQIVEVHTLVKDYIEENKVANDDPICVIMNEIGELPAPSELVEHRKTNETLSEDQINEAVMNTNITLSLIAPKVEVNQEEANRKRVFIDTIKLVVDLLNFEATDNLGTLLMKKFDANEEKRFDLLQQKRIASVSEFRTTDETSGDKEETAPIPKPLTLADTQRTIIENTKKLESYGVVQPSKDYQSLVVAVAKEIRNRRLYRKNRRFDLLRLRSAFDNLNTKDKYLTEQKEFYNQYIQTCLANLNMNTSKKSKHAKTKKVVKYNAAELYKQGVVLEVEGLSTNQFKNVQFEINATDNPGVFSISAKLFGVSMDSMELVFQDLLQLQYENVSVIYMFDRAKVNVNLLIYTINKKFYSKK